MKHQQYDTTLIDVSCATCNANALEQCWCNACAIDEPYNERLAFATHCFARRRYNVARFDKVDVDVLRCKVRLQVANDGSNGFCEVRFVDATFTIINNLN